jgi:hypothetical protein
MNENIKIQIHTLKGKKNSFLITYTFKMVLIPSKNDTNIPLLCFQFLLAIGIQIFLSVEARSESYIYFDPI